MNAPRRPDVCPRCKGPINVEDFVPVPTHRRDEVVTYLYCDGCTHGWKELWRRDGIGWGSTAVRIEYSASNVRKLAEFLAELRAAQVVAA